jgi:hypothetical protein
MIINKAHSKYEDITTKPPTDAPDYTASCKMGWGGSKSKSDVEYSPPSGGEVKNGWSYTSAPPACLHEMQGDNFKVALNPG